MKILMLGWELPPYYVGGLGIVCDQLTRQMAKDGADIEFILPFEADYSSVNHMKVTAAIDQDAQTLMSSGGTYDSINYRVTYKNGRVVRRGLYDQVDVFAANVARLVKYGEYDIIHAHDWLTLRAGILAKQKLGIPLIAHIHATEYDRSGGNYGSPLVREIEYVGLHMSDHIFAVSNRTKNTLVREYGLSPDKISVAENVMEIPSHLIDEQENTYKYLSKIREQGYKIVVNAGRMTLQKGIYHLLEAARLVVDKIPRTIFLFVGGGELITELVVQAAELGLSGNVIFTDRLEGISKEWRDAFRVGDVFVMPSVSDPFGIAPYEAIAYGTPVIISKQAGISEFLHSALKVDHWDTREMANDICSVLNSQDLHDTLLANAQQETSLMTWEPISKHILNKYEQLLKPAAQGVGA